MKLIISSLAVAASLAFSIIANPAPVQKEVTIAVNDIYVPGGTTSNSEAYVIVSGMFPNSCYKWARADITSQTPFIHEVRVVANVAQTMCMMVLIPFQHEVVFGRLASGSHTLRFVSGDGTYIEKTLRVD